MSKSKSQKIKTIPENYTAVTPWIISASTDKMIAFLKAVFNAEEIPNSKIKNDDGVIIHVVVKIDNAMVMLFDSRKGWGPTPTFLNLYVKDVEKAYKKALELGAKSVTEITPLWNGERTCRILDPFGNLLWINERVEEVDLTNTKEVKKKSSTPEAVKNVAYIQKSLDEALKEQRKFFENKQ